MLNSALSGFAGGKIVIGLHSREGLMRSSPVAPSVRVTPVRLTGCLSCAVVIFPRLCCIPDIWWRLWLKACWDLDRSVFIRVHLSLMRNALQPETDKESDGGVCAVEFLLLGISLQRERTKDIFRASLLESSDKVFQRICPTTRNRAGFLITAPLTTVKHSDQLPSLEYELMFCVLLTLLYGAKRQRSSVHAFLRSSTRSRALGTK